MGPVTVYTANFIIECWHEFCGNCNWQDGEKCLLFEQKLKTNRFNAFGEGSEILRCKACMIFCSNMPSEDFDEGEYIKENV
jgi:hypothetical protein